MLKAITGHAPNYSSYHCSTMIVGIEQISTNLVDICSTISQYLQ